MSISNRLAKHLAVAATVAVAGSANAAVVYSGLVNLAIPFNFDGLYLNVETGVNSSAAGDVAGWDINPYGTSTTGISLFAATGTGFMRNPGATTTGKTRLDAGTTVGASSFFYGSSSAAIGTLVGQWQVNSVSFFGFKFAGADSATHYGWVRMAIGATTADRKIVDYAYGSSAGEAVITGVPAPGALALLGLAGIVGKRRRA